MGSLILFEKKGNGFCHYNSSLSERLQEVLISKLPNHIVCLPQAPCFTRELEFADKSFLWAYFTKAYDVFARYIKPEWVYYDAHLRVFICYKNKNSV